MIFKTFFNSFLFLTIFFPVSAVTLKSNTQLTTVGVSEIFDVNSIIGVEITNTYTNRTWHLSTVSLSKLKSILKKSSGIKNAVTVKPGHVNVTFLFKNKIKRHFYVDTYGIFNDSRDYTSKINFPFSIQLSQGVNWDELK